MVAALIIVFREVIEAGIVVGIVMAATKTVAHRGQWIAGGVAAGVLGACLVAIFVGTITAAFAGMGQEVFNASILGIAVVMLTWHNVWMSRHGREIAAEMMAIGKAVVAGSRTLLALAIVVGIAVLREGSEVVLFLYGIVTSEGGWSSSILLGGLAGLALGAVVSTLTYLGLLRVPGRYLFAVTSLMIAFLAAGMASQAIGFLEQADIVTALNTILWDSSGILSDSSLLGKVLHTLIGYNDQPTGMQVVVYVATLAITYVLMKLAAPPPIPAHIRR
ncbi:MAG TPA: FTR1 family protein [Xanthobacteraceae bacterium]|nr:FTR1 family protein [Xanthobacteraceae bacterium]